MVGGHHRLRKHEFEQAPGDSEGQGSLACCSPCGRKGVDMTKQLNNKMTDGSQLKRCIQSSLTRKTLSTTNWHLPRALQMTEQQGHSPSASAEIAAAVAL